MITITNMQVILSTPQLKPNSYCPIFHASKPATRVKVQKILDL